LSKEFADVHNLIAAVSQQYQYPPPPRLLLILQETVTNLLRWLLDLIATLMSVVPGFTDSKAASHMIKTGVYALGVFCAILLVWVLWTRLSELGKQAELSKTSKITLEGPRSAHQWKEQALAFSQAARWKDACRAVLLSSIRLLDEQKVVPFNANRTNFEYWYALAEYEKMRPHFRSMADTVDLCWFGNKEADENDFRKCLSYLESIQSELTPNET
jgi:hypothetical protein